MIKGIGNDIIEISRIEDAIRRYGQRFLDRIFTIAEREYCLRHHESALHFAGRFAAKEAVVKAIGTGFSKGITWTDIEIVSDVDGKPVVMLSESVKKRLGTTKVLVSISHCRQFATAFAIWESA